MSIGVCVICGAEFVKRSNRQKYCSDCKVEAKLANNRANSVKYRKAAANADNTAKCYGLAANCPKDVAKDWSAEARKVRNEKKRTLRNSRSSVGNDNGVSAREIALNDLVMDQRDDDFKGSIEDFFAGKDDDE
jgi:hypothetical protein